LELLAPLATPQQDTVLFVKTCTMFSLAWVGIIDLIIVYIFVQALENFRVIWKSGNVVLNREDVQFVLVTIVMSDSIKCERTFCH